MFSFDPFEPLGRCMGPFRLFSLNSFKLCLVFSSTGSKYIHLESIIIMLRRANTKLRKFLFFWLTFNLGKMLTAVLAAT